MCLSFATVVCGVNQVVVCWLMGTWDEVQNSLVGSWQFYEFIGYFHDMQQFEWGIH